LQVDAQALGWTGPVPRLRDAILKALLAEGMVACTHNHAGPGVDPESSLPTDEAYLASTHQRIADGLRHAVDNLRPARIGVGATVEDRISFIRRFHMKNGSVQCQPGDRDQILCAEGRLDPQVGVICAKDADDRVVGLLANFACHACHHGGDTSITAGFPGQLAVALKETYGQHCAVVFRNGAFGNVLHCNFVNPRHNDNMTRMGRLLADDIQRVVNRPSMVDRAVVSARSVTLRLPLRDPDGPYGTGMKFRQPYGSEELYRAEAAKLKARYAQDPYWAAEVQCLQIGPDAVLVGMPGEYFSDDGLRIKTASRMTYTFVVGQANDKLGYIPSRKAFDGGGGTGLTGDYYDNMDFTGFALSRVDPTVNFQWGTGSPDASMGVDTFSVSWTGQVEPQYSETYTFYTNTDDGVRLWVDDQLIIDQWVDQAPTEVSGNIALSAGVKYDIEMEYYENGGGAVAELRWSSVSQPKQIIPQSQLYPTVGGGLPSPWQLTDVGDVGAVGTANHSDPTFTIEGSGAQIWDVADEFCFVYQNLSGDGSIVARVASVENTNQWALGGVMIRETLAAGSKHLLMLLTPADGTCMYWRPSTDGGSYWTQDAGRQVPEYVKVERVGDNLTGYASEDGSSWTQIGSTQTISMSTDVYVGMAVCGWNDGVLCTATFDNVDVTTGGGGPNLISNPGFESGNTDWTDWGNATAVASDAHSGTYSMQVGIGSGGRGQNVSGWTVGNPYTLSGWGKVDSGETGWIGVKALDGGGNLGEWPIEITSTSYSYGAAPFTVPTGTVTLQVYVWKSTTAGYFYADDLSLTEGGGGDTTAPEAVTDLATSNATSSSIDLSWTAPGDDGSSGTATSYDIRYSTSTIDEGNWSSTTQVSGEPAPQVAGSSESMVVGGLSASTTYYFAIKTSDEVPNVSAISNSASGTTSAAADTTPPAAVTDLATSSPTSSSITLTWTAPGDDGNTGTASSYDIRYSTSSIDEGNWAAAAQVSGEPTPQSAGNGESMVIDGLSASTTYYFAIKTSDEVPNESAISNSPSGTTTGGGGTTYINSDFQVDTSGWYIAGFARTDLGGGDWVLYENTTGSSGTAENTTPLPAAIQIDMDFQRTTNGSTGEYFGFFFHESAVGGTPTGQRGYRLEYEAKTGTKKLELYRKNSDWGSEDHLATANSVAGDTNEHHLRITDDGTGWIQIYWDDMVTPVIDIDDSANYVGGANQYIGVQSSYDLNAWIDNVMVTDY